MRSIICIISLVILIGCNNVTDSKVDRERAIPSNGEISKEEVKEPGEKKETPVKEHADVDLTTYFKPDQTTATFLGEGNEYATYTEKTTWISDQFIGTIIDNGGVTTMTIYKLGSDTIEKIFFEPIDVPADEATYPEIEQLQSLQPIETYLATPIKVGTQFGRWTIVEVGTTVETPYQQFENVFVIEVVGDDFVNRKYFAENYGDIKSEFMMHTEGEEPFVVTSTLETVEKR